MDLYFIVSNFPSDWPINHITPLLLSFYRQKKSRLYDFKVKSCVARSNQIKSRLKLFEKQKLKLSLEDICCDICLLRISKPFYFSVTPQGLVTHSNCV